MADSSDGRDICSRCSRPCNRRKESTGHCLRGLRIRECRPLDGGKMSLYQRAVEHLRENKMTYREHFRFAGGHGLRCLKAAGYLVVHAIAPCWFRRAGSQLVERMERDFDDHRRGRDV